MKAESLNDFSGGFVESEHPAAFKEGQWKKLDGFVFDSPNRLRSQWPIARIDEDGEAWELAAVEDGVLGINKAGDVKWRQLIPYYQWRASIDITDSTWNEIEVYDYNSGTPSLLSSTLDLGALNSTPRFMGAIAFSGEFGSVTDATVIDGKSDDESSSGFYYLVYDNDKAFRVDAGLPTSTSSTDYPTANVVVQWGDFTIWGDIWWFEDPDDTGSSAKRYKNGLWFSQPAQLDSYDPQDVILLPHTGVTPHVQDMIPLQSGMVVFCEGATYFLRGTADDFVIEVIETGDVSLHARDSATYFEPLDAAAWADRFGRVWVTDGSEVRRLDPELGNETGLVDGLVMDLDPDIAAVGDTNRNRWNPSCTSLGDVLVVARSTGHELMCFHLIGRSTGVWTKLRLPDFGDTGSADFSPVFLRSSADHGAIYFIHQAFTSSANNRMVWIDVENHTRLNRGSYFWWDSVAGAQQEASLDLTIGTPVLATGSGHERAWWHRVGVRLGKTEDADAQLVGISQWTTGGDTDDRADGTFEDALAAADLDDGLAFPTALHTNVVHRKHVVVPGIGPSRQYRAEFVFNGDVTVEGVTVWADGAADDRGRHPEQAGNSGTV